MRALQLPSTLGGAVVLPARSCEGGGSAAMPGPARLATAGMGAALASGTITCAWLPRGRPALPLPRHGLAPAQRRMSRRAGASTFEDGASQPLYQQVPEAELKHAGGTGMALFKEDVRFIKAVMENAKPPPLPLEYSDAVIALHYQRQPQLVVARLAQVVAVAASFAASLAWSKLGGKLPAASSAEGAGGGEGAPLAGSLDALYGGVSDDANEADEAALALAARDAVLALGPTVIKVAQSLASRPDLVGERYSKALSKLQDDVPSFPTADAHQIIREDLGREWHEIFSELSPEPIAAASLGQVYRGRTHEGREVAVKVQRPGLLPRVSIDIFILRGGLQVLRKTVGINQDLRKIADELGEGLYGELDYRREAANSREFAHAHRHLPFVMVPEVLQELTSARVLTCEWVEGERPARLAAVATTGAPGEREEAREYLASVVGMGVQCSLSQLLETRVMHADPHPGNLLFTPDGRLCYLDFGLLTHVRQDHADAMLAAVAHLVAGDFRGLARDLDGMGMLKEGTDPRQLAEALDQSLSKYLPGEGAGSADLQFGDLAKGLAKVAVKFRFRLPPYYTLVLRSLATLEGIGLAADPGFKIVRSAYPFVLRRMLADNRAPIRALLKELVIDPVDGGLDLDKAGMLARYSQRKDTEYIPAAEAEALEGAELPEGAGAATKVMEDVLLSRRGAGARRVLLEANAGKVSEQLLASSRVRALAAKLMAETMERWLGGARAAKRAAEEILDAEGRARRARLSMLVGTFVDRVRARPLQALRVAISFAGVLAAAVAIVVRRAVARMLGRGAGAGAVSGEKAAPAAPLAVEGGGPGGAAGGGAKEEGDGEGEDAGGGGGGGGLGGVAGGVEAAPIVVPVPVPA